MSRRVDPIKTPVPQTVSTVTKSVTTTPTSLFGGKNKMKVVCVGILGLLALVMLVKFVKTRKQVKKQQAAEEATSFDSPDSTPPAPAQQWKSNHQSTPTPRPHHHFPIRVPVPTPAAQPVAPVQPAKVMQRHSIVSQGVVIRPADHVGLGSQNMRQEMTRPEKAEFENDLPPGDVNQLQQQETSPPPPVNAPQSSPPSDVPGDFNPL